MPAITLRLSDEQHEELRSVAFHGGRGWSIQKEILRRCFGAALAERDHGNEVSPEGKEAASRSTAGSPVSPPPSRSASVVGKRSFTPDPKGSK